jgi:cytochrome c2
MSKGRVLALGLALAMGFSGTAALAGGDAKNGAKVFKKRCFVCHSIKKGDKKKKMGPNLFGIIGAKPARTKGFKYSKSYVQAAEKGLLWDEKAILEYLADPKGFIRRASGDPKGKSRMNKVKLKKSEPNDIIAYLKTQE